MDILFKNITAKKGENLVVTKMRLKKLLTEIIDKYIADLDIQNLRRVIIYPNNSKHSFAKMQPIDENNAPMADIIFQESIVNFLNSTSHKEAREIIYHELCHCKDFQNLCSMFDYKKLLDFENSKTTLTAMYADCGYRMWGEYISYFYTEKEFPLFQNKFASKISETVKDADVAITLLKEQKSNEDLIFAYRVFKEKIDLLFYSIVREIAKIHSIENSEITAYTFKLFVEINKRIPGVQTVASQAMVLLEKSRGTYPKWTDINIFNNLGTIFYSLYCLSDIFLPESVI